MSRRRIVRIADQGGVVKPLPRLAFHCIPRSKVGLRRPHDARPAPLPREQILNNIVAIRDVAYRFTTGRPEDRRKQAQLLVLALMISAQEGMLWASAAYFASIIGCHKSTFYRLLARLRREALVKTWRLVRQDGTQSVNLYDLFALWVAIRDILAHEKTFFRQVVCRRHGPSSTQRESARWAAEAIEAIEAMAMEAMKSADEREAAKWASAMEAMKRADEREAAKWAEAREWAEKIEAAKKRQDGEQ